RSPVSAVGDLLEYFPSDGIVDFEGSGQGLFLQADEETSTLLKDSFARERQHTEFARSILGAQPGETMIVVNGR
ncbi:hypothetical protein HK405_010482, partial [Cladochytrium tenue]